MCYLLFSPIEKFIRQIYSKMYVKLKVSSLKKENKNKQKNQSVVDRSQKKSVPVTAMSGIDFS